MVVGRWAVSFREKTRVRKIYLAASDERNGFAYTRAVIHAAGRDRLTASGAQLRTADGGMDTPVPVLAPGLGKTKTGRLIRDDRPAGDQTPPAVWFAYTPDRKGEQPKHT